jgi:hypothetical protein
MDKIQSVKDNHEVDFIDRALKMLLTPDGKGKYKKAQMLSELCQTQNPNYIRERLTKYNLI